eukprot:COSAG02_NODE_4762_length_5013_cov_5.204314_4_plen_99_part_00
MLCCGTGSYVKVGTELTTFLAAASDYVPKTTKVVSAALNATLLIDGGHRAPNAGGDPAANDHNPKIPGGINMNQLSPQQRCESCLPIETGPHVDACLA